MSEERIKLPDHRGVPCFRASDGHLVEQGIKPDSIGLPSDKGLKAKEKWWHQKQYHWTEALSLLYIFPLFGSAQLVVNNPKSAINWIICGSIWIVSLWLRPLTGRFWNKSVAPEYENVLISKKLCPACVYSLDSLTPEPDGCTVCPECGAAWRLPEAKSNEPSP